MNDELLHNLRHSLAHVLAAAVARIYGYENVKFGVGPTVADGFYYDFDFGETKISEEDLAKIEKEMRKIIAEKQDFSREEKSISAAENWAREKNQPYKFELIEDLKNFGTTDEKSVENAKIREKNQQNSQNSENNSNEILKQAQNDNNQTLRKNSKLTDETVAKITTVSFYKNGEFEDLCRGGHVKNTGEIAPDAFKLSRIAGAYWRGDEKNKMMTRIYGIAFAKKAELSSYLQQLSEAKLRDHRKLGKDLDLFLFSDLVGAGLPIFTPRGTVLREKLAEFSNELREKIGFEKVWTPHITKTDLYKISGHLAKFGEGFAVEGQISRDKFMMKPMNCPHHTRIYANRARSYRDLPLRFLETTTDYRDEKTGELGGLSRVRSLTQDDSHVFCRADQIETEIANLMNAVRELYATVEMKLRVRLSYRDDSDNYLGEKSMWESAQKQLKNAVISANLDFFEQTGEAAFYGPKIDFMATDALGREHQLATAQLDFVQPARFNLTYSDENGEDSQPIMIHCALLGSIERFLSVYIEHTAGKFPVWCAPEQLRIISVNDSKNVVKFATDLRNLAFNFGVRAKVDDSNNSVGKKIRESATQKIPYTAVIGEREAESGEISVRIRADLAKLTDENIVDFTIKDSDDFAKKSSVISSEAEKSQNPSSDLTDKNVVNSATKSRENSMSKFYSAENLVEKIAREAKMRAKKSTL